MIPPTHITDNLWVSWSPADVRAAAFRVIDRTQDQPHTQLVGIAVALVALCDALKVDPRHLFATVEGNLRDVETPFAGTVEAIRQYARNEITRTPR